MILYKKCLLNFQEILSKLNHSDTKQLEWINDKK